MYPRHITSTLLDALADSPVVLLGGARQVGKSTLARELASAAHPARYVTLDDATVLAAAQADAQGFLAGLEKPVVIDEIQRAPQLFLAIKADVDRHRQSGRYLLTGSANVWLLPRLSESLAGRMEVFTLRTLSQGEIEGAPEGFIDALFSKDPLPTLSGKADHRTRLFQRMLAGGYPEVLARSGDERRRAWFGSYLTTILQRDVRDLANITGLTEMPRLLSLLAARAASLMNFAEISRSVALPQSSVKRYMALLEATYLVEPLPAWSASLGRRMVKASKLWLGDTGLVGYLQGLSQDRLATDPGLAGPLVENFVVMELRKQIAWSRTSPALFHFRTQTGQEVDVVMEDRAGRLVGVEVKAAATVGAGDFKGLRALSEAAGRRFHRGVVLYTGTEPAAFGQNFYALPISALWRLSARKEAA
jgi:hypothetical protein